MHLTNYIAPLLILLGSARENPVSSRGARTVLPAAAPSVVVVGNDNAARFRYHFLLWNMTTATVNVHLGSSLAGCSSTYNNIGPGQAFERGNYHDKWDNGKICAGACWTSVDAYTTNGNHHVVHFTPTSKFPQVTILAGAGAANIAVGMAALAALGPAAAVGFALEGGAMALTGVLSAGGPCHGFDLAMWTDPKSGGWTVIDRYPGDYDVFKSEILPKVKK